MTFASWLRGLAHGNKRNRRVSRAAVSRCRRSSLRLAVEHLEDRTVPSASVDFAAAQTFASGGSSPISVAAADFNNDGAADLAVANFGGSQDSGSVGVLLGDGTGGFAPAVTLASGGANPRAVAVGDFNNDGAPDLAVANLGGSTVGVLLGNGLGGFAAAVTFASGGYGPSSLAVADFDNDGHDDLAITNNYNFGLPGSGAGMAVLLGDGTGGFGPAVAFATRDFIPDPAWQASLALSVATGDFNNDGKADLVVTNWDWDNNTYPEININTVGVLLGDGTGGFAPAVTFDSGGFTPVFVAVADLNQDGRADLVVANSDSSNVGVFLGNGVGNFAHAATVAASAPGSIAIGDFNNDGQADLAVASQLVGVGVLLGNGLGGFAAPVTFGTGGAWPFSIVAADFDNDGRTDLAVANYFSTTVGVLLNTTNQPPVNTVPVGQVVSEDGSKVISGLSVADDDAAGVLTVTISVGHGKLTVNNGVAGGLTATNITGNGTTTVTMTGTQAQINATLAGVNGLVYLGGLNYSGLDTLTMTTTDAGGLSDADIVTIEVRSAQQQTQVLTAIIAGLEDQHVISRGHEIVLTGMLNLLSSPILGAYAAFVFRVQARILVGLGRLTPQQGNDLIQSMESIRVSLR